MGCAHSRTRDSFQLAEQMIRVAFIHNNFPAGGAERITMDIAAYLSTQEGRYESYVYASRIASDKLPEDTGSTLTVRKIPTDKIPFRKAAAIRKLIQEDRIDILVQVVKRVKGIGQIRRRTGCKVIFANHGVPFWEEHAIIHRRRNNPAKKIFWKLLGKKIYLDMGRARKLAVRRSLRNYQDCDAYTVLCESYKRQICRELGIKPDASRVVSIYNPERSLPEVNYDKKNIVLFCGRLNAQKRVSRLLRIWTKVQDELPHWHLKIVGDGPDRSMAESMIRELGLQRVSLEGWRSDTAAYYQEASVLCLVSQYEGWPLALTEAQANGVIPIAFNCCDGVREILSPEGVHGFTVEPFNEDAFARTLVRVAGMSEEDKTEIRKNIVRRIRNFSPENTAREWARLFDRLYNEKR